MTGLGASVDLTNVLQPTWSDPGIRIDICWLLQMSGGGKWGATIYKRRFTASGREGKPTAIVTLTADTVEQLLQDVALSLAQTEPIAVIEPRMS